SSPSPASPSTEASAATAGSSSLHCPRRQALGAFLQRAMRAIAASLRLAQRLAARSGSVYLQCPWRSGPGGPSLRRALRAIAASLRLAQGSLRDQVLAGSKPAFGRDRRR